MKYLLIFHFRITDNYNPSDFTESSIEKEVDCKPEELKRKISEKKDSIQENCDGTIANSSRHATAIVSLKQVVPLG